jgi:hypothetical protein
MSFVRRTGYRVLELASAAPFLYEVVDHAVNNDPIDKPLAIGSLVVNSIVSAFNIRDIRREAVENAQTNAI